MDRELRVPVTETAHNTVGFSGFHFIDISFDYYLEGIPVSFSVAVSASRHGGYEASLICQTNLDEPEYAHWEFRDFLNKLAEGGYIGFFRLYEHKLSDDDSRNCLLYEYKLPVPADGNISESMIECVVSRFLNDVAHAATFYFESFFYPFTSHTDGDDSDTSSDAQRSKCGSASKVILFPLKRGNKKC
ncbi:MAG: hypothetical protein WA003_02170 [Desulfuromonadaceae bacterium]